MFKFAWPWMFIILPLPILFYWLLPPVKNQQTRALKLPFFHAIQPIINEQQTFSSKAVVRLLLASLIWILLVSAAARPQWLGNPIQLPRAGRDIMLAVDLSGSMSTPDMSWHGQHATRLQVVKAVAKQFIANRRGDRLGLILFGTRAYLQTPLTFDRKTVEQMLDDATVGLAGIQTAIGDAMGLAIKRLQHYPQGSRILILLTDGGNNAGNVLPIDAARIAKEEHVRIYTIGLGAERMLVQTLFGPQYVNPSSDLDEKTLQEIAKMTGGLYFRATSAEDLRSVYQNINKLEPTKGNAATYRPITALYFWPLSLAFILILCRLIFTILMKYIIGRDSLQRGILTRSAMRGTN